VNPENSHLLQLSEEELPAEEAERLARVDALLRRVVQFESNHLRETYELRLGFRELSLIYKSLQAAKTLGALPPQDELLDDTIQLVDQALSRAV
jgi:hypothetical protein